MRPVTMGEPSCPQPAPSVVNARQTRPRIRFGSLPASIAHQRVLFNAAKTCYEPAPILKGNIEESAQHNIGASAVFRIPHFHS